MASSHSDTYYCLLNATKNLTEENASYFLYNATASFAVTVVLPLIMFFGVLINSAFFYVVGRVRRMHTVTNLFLCNLAVADTLFLILGCGEQILLYINSPVDGDRFSVGRAGCVIIPLLIYTCYFATLAFVTIVSVHRFFATCRPLNLKMIRSKSRAIKLSVIAWIVSMMMAMMIIPESYNMVIVCVHWPSKPMYAGFPGMIGFCVPKADWVHAFADLFRCIPFFATMIGNSMLYVSIMICLLSRSTKRRQQQYDEPSSQFSNAQKRNGASTTKKITPLHSQVARMLVINGIVFFLCQAPHQVASLASAFGYMSGRHTSVLDPGQFLMFTWFSKALVYVNSVLNPIIYNLTNNRYRKAFRESLGWKC